MAQEEGCALFQLGDWVWLEQHQQQGRVIDTHDLWGVISYTVWLSASNQVIKVDADQLSPFVASLSISAASIAYLAAAARVAASQQEEILLAPMSTNVIPLPHQLKALNKAISQSQVRYLLADEVGLGKTIEAGLIMRELKLRGLVRRILVVAPKGLATQWVSEMQVHFNEPFELIIPGDVLGPRTDIDENIWQQHDQVICPMDSIKPMEKRRGWNLDKINQYNKQRFDDVISAGWDLIVVDESHRLQGSTDTVARFKLGQGLADAAPYFLLLSATPHQGKSDGFHRLMSLLDAEHFPDEASVTQERVKPYVIRTEKHQAIDAEGNALFRPRKTQLVSVAWQANHHIQRELYEAVTDYVREGYNQALATKQNAIGFLMILMQRLVVSSPAAIKATLQRRLDVLNKPSLAEQASLMSTDEWEDLDGQQQADELNNTKIKALDSKKQNEKQEVQWLLNLAEQCVQQGIDAKADALLDWVTRLQREEDDPNLKVLIFTEFVPTQRMLAEFMKARGMSVVILNGDLSMAQRKQVQKSFAEEIRVLISTDAGGEGLNLQFCHVIINYDIPWNPMRLEQRIGRVDRIGQKKVVRAINLVFEDTVEHRVREVLEEKLNIILEEFGVDKTGDVLDSAQAGKLFDELYTGAINNPDAIDGEIEKALVQLKAQAAASTGSKELFADDTPVNVADAEKISQHPLPYWMERMTLNYLQSQGGQAIKNADATWQLTWPDGERWSSSLFDNKLSERFPSAEHVTLDQPKIRHLLQDLPVWMPAQSVPVVSIPSIPDAVDGLWSLWQISLDTSGLSQSKHVKQTAYFPVYQTMEGKAFPATAKRIWEALLSHDASIINAMADDCPQDSVFMFVRQEAEKTGFATFETLKDQFIENLEQEKKKAAYGFNAREKALDRIGLSEVKTYRLNKLNQEKQQWHNDYQARQTIKPELDAILLLRVRPAG